MLEDEIRTLTLVIRQLIQSLSKFEEKFVIENKKSVTTNGFIPLDQFCKAKGISRGLYYKNKHLFNTKRIGRKVFVKDY